MPGRTFVLRPIVYAHLDIGVDSILKAPYLIVRMIVVEAVRGGREGIPQDGVLEADARIHPVVVLEVHHGCQANLLQIRDAGGLPGLFAGLGEDGEEDGRQDGDDGDNDEQLDEGEPSLASLRKHC